MLIHLEDFLFQRLFVSGGAGGALGGLIDMSEGVDPRRLLAILMFLSSFD
jgi:hypothetical protein